MEYKKLLNLRKYFRLNNSKNTIYQNVWGTAKH